MIHRGVATFTLDHGHCPPWLFSRMRDLGGEMIEIIIAEYGPDEFVKRVSEPGWFQSLGTVLAFDWNASGLTTILTAALKEAIRGRERELGIAIAGGKGKTSRKTPDDIAKVAPLLDLPHASAENLIYNSKMSAKVDSALVQDGFTLYHHTFFFSKNGAWTVVQQGMNTERKAARRYHWHSENIKDLVVEPHTGISSDAKTPTLNLVARESVKTQKVSTELVNQPYGSLMKDMVLLQKHSSKLSRAVRVQKKTGERLSVVHLAGREFYTHPVTNENFAESPYLKKVFGKITEAKPESYEKLVSLPGVGAKTLRALALVSEVIYGAPPSYVDPARYSFAHGGKDATPYAVDRPTYDDSIEFFRKVIQKLKRPEKEKEALLQKLPF